MIHLPYVKCMHMLHSVFDKFLKANVFQEKKADQEFEMKKSKELEKIDMKLQSNHKTSCSFVSQTELQLGKSKLDGLEKKKLKQIMVEAMAKSGMYEIVRILIFYTMASYLSLFEISLTYKDFCFHL